MDLFLISSAVTQGLGKDLLADELSLHLGASAASVERSCITRFVRPLLTNSFDSSQFPSSTISDPQCANTTCNPSASCREAREMSCHLTKTSSQWVSTGGQTSLREKRLAPLSLCCWRAGTEGDVPCTFPRVRWDAESAKERSSLAQMSSS